MAKKRQKPAVKRSRPEKHPKKTKKGKVQARPKRAPRKTAAQKKRSAAAVRGWATRRKNAAALKKANRKVALLEQRIAKLENAILAGARSTVRLKLKDELSAVRLIGLTPVPAKMRKRFTPFAKALARYGDTGDPYDYDVFKQMKRDLYAAHPDEEDLVSALLKEAAEQAGWDEERSLRFMKLS